MSKEIDLKKGYENRLKTLCSMYLTTHKIGSTGEWGVIRADIHSQISSLLFAYTDNYYNMIDNYHIKKKLCKITDNLWDYLNKDLDFMDDINVKILYDEIIKLYNEILEKQSRLL